MPRVIGDYFQKFPGTTLGPCPDCGRSVPILRAHLDAITELARAVAPFPGSFVLDLDSFDGTDWTALQVPPSAYARVVMAGKWIQPVWLD